MASQLAASCMHAHQELPRSGRSVVVRLPEAMTPPPPRDKEKMPNPNNASVVQRAVWVYLCRCERVSLSCLCVTSILLVGVGRIALLSEIVFLVWLKLLSDSVWARQAKVL